MLLHDSCYKSHRMAPKNDTMHVRSLELFNLVWERKHCTLSSDAPSPHWIFSLTRGSVGKQASHWNLSLRNKRLIQIVVSGTQHKIQSLWPQGIWYSSAVQYRWIQELWELWKGPPPNLSPNYTCQPQESVMATFSHLLFLNGEEVCGTEDWLSKALPTVPWIESKFTAETTNDQHTTLHGVQA